MFYAPGLVFGGTNGIRSHFYVLRIRTRFWRYRGRQVPFSCLGSWAYFRWYRGRQVSISCFALQDTFSVVPRSSIPVLMFCAPRFIFGSSVGVGSCFHVLRARTHFRQYRGHPVPFLCFDLPDSFSTEPRASAPISCFSLSGTFSAVRRASGLDLMFCALRLVSTEPSALAPILMLFRSRTHFRRYKGCRISISCFAGLNSLSAVPRALGPVFMFGLPGTFSAVPRLSGLDFMFCAP
jgi:hypothetical protein